MKTSVFFSLYTFHFLCRFDERENNSGQGTSWRKIRLSVTHGEVAAAFASSFLLEVFQSRGLGLEFLSTKRFFLEKDDWSNLENYQCNNQKENEKKIKGKNKNERGRWRERERDIGKEKWGERYREREMGRERWGKWDSKREIWREREIWEKRDIGKVS